VWPRLKPLTVPKVWQQFLRLVWRRPAGTSGLKPRPECSERHHRRALLMPAPELTARGFVTP
jgi:hypothetical protein